MVRSDVHRCRFTSWRPREITALAINEELELIAIGRSDSSVEIWNLEYKFFLISVLGGKKYGGKVKSLQWYKYESEDRLIVVTDDYIYQWDLETMSLIQQLPSTGGDILSFSMNLERNIIAVGVSGMSVHLYTIQGGDEYKDDASKLGLIGYGKALPKIMGYPQCLDWVDNERIAVGTKSQLLTFNVDSGELLVEVDTPEITALAAIDDDNIICGHPSGAISFHELKYGSTVQESKFHYAPIRTIVVSKEYGRIYLSGDDPALVRLSRFNDKWGLDGLHRRQTHDVRALANYKDKTLISGGVSTILNFADIPTFSNVFRSVTENHKSYPVNNVSMATLEDPTNPERHIKLLLESSQSSISLWKLGSHDFDSTTIDTVLNLPSGSHLPIKEGVKKLVQFEIRDKEYIRCIALSRDGQYFAYCTSASIKLYALNWSEELETVSIERVKSFDQGSDIIKFTPSSKHLVTSSKSVLTIYTIEKLIKQQQMDDEEDEEEEEDDNIGVLTIQSPTKGSKPLSTLHMDIDESGTYVATVDSKDNVHLFNITRGVWVINIPNRLHVSCLAFHNDTTPQEEENHKQQQQPLLYIANADEIVVYNPKSLKTVNLAPSPGKAPILFMTAHPNDSTRMILWSHDTLYTAPWDRLTEYTEQNIFTEVFAAGSLDKQLVTVELSYNEQILPNLPPAIRGKVYGTN